MKFAKKIAASTFLVVATMLLVAIQPVQAHDTQAACADVTPQAKKNLCLSGGWAAIYLKGDTDQGYYGTEDLNLCPTGADGLFQHKHGFWSCHPHHDHDIQVEYRSDLWAHKHGESDGKEWHSFSTTTNCLAGEHKHGAEEGPNRTCHTPLRHTEHPHGLALPFTHKSGWPS